MFLLNKKEIAYYKTSVDTFLPEMEVRPRDTKVWGKTEEKKQQEKEELIEISCRNARLPD